MVGLDTGKISSVFDDRPK